MTLKIICSLLSFVECVRRCSYCQEKLSIWLFFIFCFAWDKLYDKVSVENVMLMNVFFFIWYAWCFRPKKTVFLSVYVCFFKVIKNLFEIIEFFVLLYRFLFTLRNRRRQLNSCLFLWDSLRFLSCITYWYYFRYFTESLIL